MATPVLPKNGLPPKTVAEARELGETRAVGETVLPPKTVAEARAVGGGLAAAEDRAAAEALLANTTAGGALGRAAANEAGRSPRPAISRIRWICSFMPASWASVVSA